MADYYAFDEKLIGLEVKAMDDEHRQLIDKMNRLHKAHLEKRTTAELKRLLDDLASYTVTHFRDEEKYMESIEFKGLENHKLIHQRLLEKFKSHADDFATTGVLTPKFFEFLSSWLTTHIRGIDRKYAEATKSKAG